MRIMLADRIADEGVELIENAGYQALKVWDRPKEELPGLIVGCDAMIVRSATKVTAELMDSAPNLKVIGRAGIGLDNVDLEHAKARGIQVVNTPTATTISVAELTMTLMLACFRDVVTGTVTTKQGKWEKKALKGLELHGKTLGVIGIGRIGRAVAERAEAFGMRILAYDPYVKSERWENATFDEIIERSDVLTLHLPLTPETRHMLSDREFARMRDGTVILNAARGGTIDEDALLEALESGRVRKAALDVFEKEPPAGSKLLEHPNLICTPHIGAQTVEGQKRAGIMVAEAVLKELAGV